jgi:threonylcarbamoyladenosine tRNA methylthiotransferase MtaB
MNRKYDLDYFKNRIKEIKNLRDDISITTDLIVGFPGESDDDFRETIDTLKEIGFTKIHTFPYSKRDGTPAAMMSNQVDGLVKKKRVRDVLEISNRYEREYYLSYVGKVLDGLVEVHKDGRVIVLTSNYISVIVDSKLESNSLVSVRIDRVDDERQVYGTIII